MAQLEPVGQSESSAQATAPVVDPVVAAAVATGVGVAVATDVGAAEGADDGLAEAVIVGLIEGASHEPLRLPVVPVNISVWVTLPATTQHKV
jgi:hypothetical protein